MLELQFYVRIVVIALFGILFIVSMFKRGKNNSIENPPEKHVGFIILSGIFLVLSLVSLTVGILTIVNIQFPTQMVGQPITSNMIVRSTSNKLIWGYPTQTQNIALSNISNVFAFLAFAAYFAVFRKSGTNTWQKIRKLIYIILLYMFFSSATDLHYFDVFELFAPIAFLILASTGILLSNDTLPEPVVSEKEKDDKNMLAEALPSDTTETSIETTDVVL